MKHNKRNQCALAAQVPYRRPLSRALGGRSAMATIRRLRVFTTIVAATTAFCCEATFATTWVRQPVSVYFQNAEIVARISVRKAEAVETEYEGKRVWCTTRVVADVVESLKGEADAVDFQIAGMMLNLGEEYIVFLSSPGEPSVSPMTSTNSLHQSERRFREKACSRHIKGYQGNWLNISAFVHRWSEVKSEYEPWVTPAHNVSIPSEANVEFQSVKLRALVIDGEVIEKKYWSVDDRVPMPDIFWMYEGAFSWESYRNHILESSIGNDDD